VTEDRTIRILAVDDHPLLREGIGALVAAEPDIELVGACSTGREAIQQFRALRPDVTLMDLQMPEMSGIDAIMAIRDEFPDARILVLTTFSGDMQVLRAIKAGAAGYVLKEGLHKNLLDIIRSVHSGRRTLSPEASAQLADHFGDEALTDVEIDVLRLIAAGYANKQIADRLQVAESTVKNRVQNILAKLGASDRTHAAVIGVKRGIIDLP
jgi:DNA-binding NarL/FixJ family response regulator